MAWRSLIPEQELTDVRQDRKNAVGIEKYKISANALYMQGEYLPLKAVTGVRLQPSTYTPNCACGKGIPVYKLRVDYGTENPLVLMMEKEKNAERLLSAISDVNPGARIERASAP
ncbi:MAG: hypothetical protein K6G42_09315 [Lachnospiraceae bacterium]|nr:hypothetical protein [Lachnospiraceae bacterium]